MKGPGRKAFILLVGAAMMLIGGCGGQQAPPSVKKSRIIAAENIELKKEVEQRTKEIETLREQYSEQLDKQEKLLAACQQEKETWKKKSQQNIRDQVKGVLDAVIEENLKLREENKQLKAQVEELRNQPQQRKDAEKQPSP